MLQYQILFEISIEDQKRKKSLLRKLQGFCPLNRVRTKKKVLTAFWYYIRPRPGATGDIPGRAPPPKSLLVPPKRELCPPSKDCAPKKVTGSVPLECSLSPETPKLPVITPEFVSKNCFFRRFCDKDPFCCFTLEFVEICPLF